MLVQIIISVKCTKIVPHLDYLGRSILFKCTTFAIRKINPGQSKPADEKTASEADVVEALKTVCDPEIMINVYAIYHRNQRQCLSPCPK